MDPTLVETNKANNNQPGAVDVASVVLVVGSLKPDDIPSVDLLVAVVLAAGSLKPNDSPSAGLLVRVVLAAGSLKPNDNPSVVLLVVVGREGVEVVGVAPNCNEGFTALGCVAAEEAVGRKAEKNSNS